MKAIVFPYRILCFYPMHMENTKICWHTSQKWLIQDPKQTVTYASILKKEDAYWIDDNVLGIKKQKITAFQYQKGTYKGQEVALYFDDMRIPRKKQVLSFDRQDLVIGRTIGDLQIQTPYISNPHIRFKFYQDHIMVMDEKSENGMYVNQRRCQKQSVTFGDCICFIGVCIMIAKGCMIVYHDTPMVWKENLHSIDLPLSLSQTQKQDTIVLAPTQHSFVFTKIQLRDPPPMEKTSRMPLLYLLGPGLTTGIASFFTTFLHVIGASEQTSVQTLPSFVMAFSMLASSFIWPWLMQRYEQKKEKNKEVHRIQVYRDYLEKQETFLQDQLQQYRNWMNRFDKPDRIEKESLWKQSIATSSWFFIFGRGDKQIAYPIQLQQETWQIEKDSCREDQHHFVHTLRNIKDIVIAHEALQTSIIQICGKKADQIAYAQYLLEQFLWQYPPHQIQLVFFTSTSYDDWIPRFLPHNFDESGYRYICDSIAGVQNTLMHLRQQQKPACIFALDPLFHSILQKEELPSQSIVLCFHAEVWNNLSTLQVDKQEGVWSMNDIQQRFTWKKSKQDLAFALQVQRMHILSKTQSSFPSVLSFLQLYQVQDVRELMIEKRWEQARSEISLQACIGVDDLSRPLYLDLHEKAHGPHGIIAGMTGSGKSEWLITLILSFAISYPPSDVAFVLIDYKGGGMAKALADLPHVAGIITNLDGNMIERSLLALEAELVYRQQLFAKTMQEQNTTSMNIDLYQHLYHSGQTTQAIPHLVIVADEFAELKQQQPQFMEQLIKAARIGRSLGIHLLLATQKPAGIVDDQIWSNARFHVCLKVAEKADSMDMLKREEGALLKDTGRFYLQVGYNEIFVEGQCAYAKAIYDKKMEEKDVFLYQINSANEVVNQWNKTKQAKKTKSELDMLLQHIQQIAKKRKLTTRMLLPLPLEKQWNSVNIAKGMFALVDDPRRQRQDILYGKQCFCNTLVIGSRRNELEACLGTFLHVLEDEEEKDIILFDFDQGNLQIYRNHPYVYSYLQEDDEEDLIYIMEWLLQQWKLQKRKLRNRPIFLLIHHVEVLLEQEEFYHWLFTLCHDQGRNQIYVWLSISSMQVLRMRMQQQFSNLFIFPLEDAEEYKTLCQKTTYDKECFGRMHWKQSEVKEALCVRYPSKQYDASCKRKQMPQLPKRLSRTWLEKQEQYNCFGISIQTREQFCLEKGSVWIVSGSDAKDCISLWISWAKQNKTKLVVTEDIQAWIIDSEAIVLLYIPVQKLAIDLHASWFALEKLLWIGKGLDTIRYLFPQLQTLQDGQAFDGYRFDERAEKIRWLSM